MKALNFILVSATSLVLASCADKSPKTYVLDSENSKLEWKGSLNPEYFHVGTVKVTEGTIEVQEDKLVSGHFTIDLNQIEGTDKTMSAEKNNNLAKHLKESDFFHVAKFPKVEVTVDGYENGKLSAIIKVKGKEIKEKLDVKFKSNDKEASLKGKFIVDFASLKMEAFEPDPESGESLDTKVDFTMDLKMKKK